MLPQQSSMKGISEKGMHQTYLDCSLSIEWLLDSDAADHMTTCIDLLFDVRYDSPSFVQIANGSNTKNWLWIYIR